MKDLEALANRITGMVMEPLGQRPSLVRPLNRRRRRAAEDSVSRPCDLWICGEHRVLCADSTTVARLLGDWKPALLVTDPPYGIELDSEWRDRAGLNGCGPAEASYMKERTQGHTETTFLWRHARRVVRGLRTRTKSPDRIRLARLRLHPRGSGWASSDWGSYTP